MVRIVLASLMIVGISMGTANAKTCRYHIDALSIRGDYVAIEGTEFSVKAEDLTLEQCAEAAKNHLCNDQEVLVEQLHAHGPDRAALHALLQGRTARKELARKRRGQGRPQASLNPARIAERI